MEQSEKSFQLKVSFNSKLIIKSKFLLKLFYTVRFRSNLDIFYNFLSPNKFYTSNKLLSLTIKLLVVEVSFLIDKRLVVRGHLSIRMNMTQVPSKRSWHIVLVNGNNKSF